MRVDVLDPAAYTPPYDHALCAALARAGADVRLVTGPFRHGALPRPDGFSRVVRPRRRHPAALLLDRARGRVRHFQWLPLQEIEQVLVRAVPRPWVLTAHDVLPREPRPGQRAAAVRLLHAADAVVVHSEHGAARLRALGVAEPEVIPHGVLDPGPPTRLPPELRDDGSPVVLLLGLLRPYKGLDVLLDAWRDVRGDGQLWVVGAPRMALPESLPARSRLVARFVADGEASALLRRADVVVLPYREIDQSGVLFAALHAGRPLVLSAVGGFPEVGAGELVPPGDAGALAAVLSRLLADPGERDRLAAQSRAAARERFGWDAIARRHLDLYRRLGP